MNICKHCVRKHCVRGADVEVGSRIVSGVAVRGMPCHQLREWGVACTACCLPAALRFRSRLVLQRVPSLSGAYAHSLASFHSIYFLDDRPICRWKRFRTTFASCSPPQSSPSPPRPPLTLTRPHHPLARLPCPLNSYPASPPPHHNPPTEQLQVVTRHPATTAPAPAVRQGRPPVTHCQRRVRLRLPLSRPLRWRRRSGRCWRPLAFSWEAGSRECCSSCCRCRSKWPLWRLLQGKSR